MTESYRVVACTECGVFWTPDLEPAQCDNSEHKHKQYELHRHRSIVVFPDGTPVTGVSFDAKDPYRREHAPGYGLYLDDRWRPPWPHDHLDWPDFGLPADMDEFVAALQSTLDHARAGERVEVGCLGGHGRTGTALAGLAILSGVPSPDAVAWIRSNYCTKAVETAAQEALVLTLSR